jgi:hypothetical protein
VRLECGNPPVGCAFDNRSANRVLGPALRDGGCLEDPVHGNIRRGIDVAHAYVAERDRARLVEHDGIKAPQRLQVHAAFDNDSMARGATDGSKNGQRSRVRVVPVFRRY